MGFPARRRPSSPSPREVAECRPPSVLQPETSLPRDNFKELKLSLPQSPIPTPTASSSSSPFLYDTTPPPAPPTFSPRPPFAHLSSSLSLVRAVTTEMRTEFFITASPGHCPRAGDRKIDNFPISIPPWNKCHIFFIYNCVKNFFKKIYYVIFKIPHRHHWRKF